MDNKLFENVWDYSKQAKSYKYRPNYPEKAIDILTNYTGAKKSNYSIADIGAGTGNLTILLLKRGFKVFAIEPNDEMRKIGMQVTIKFSNAQWIKANGIKTTLQSKAVNWVTFGSSFNVMDRTLALKETYRLLKKNGFFTCMWNHRDLNDPIQTTAENIIISKIPNYIRGVRRDDQRSIIEEHKKLFNNIFYFELDFEVKRTIDEYINGWKSVRNKFWDLSSDSGRTLFEEIVLEMKKQLPKSFTIKYTTRAWTAQKV